MTLYDSSVLIDYLAGETETVEYVESRHDERAVAPPIVLFEVYQGEIYKSGPAEFAAIDGALEWLTITEVSRDTARAAAELQNTLFETGTPLKARDAFIAGAAKSRDEVLAVSDSDFDIEGLADEIRVDFV